MRYASLIGLYGFLAFATIATLACHLVEADAAPAIATIREPITGDLDFVNDEEAVTAESAPVLMVLAEGDGVATQTWLVFSNAQVEAEVRKLESGTRVKVRGRHGQGGRWRYLIVDTIAKE